MYLEQYLGIGCLVNVSIILGIDFTSFYQLILVVRSNVIMFFLFVVYSYKFVRVWDI